MRYEEIAAAMIRLIDQNHADVVLTTGGTGLGPRDVTPEATKADGGSGHSGVW